MSLTQHLDYWLNILLPYLPWISLAGLFIAVLSALATPYLLIQIPADYFVNKATESQKHPILRRIVQITRNLLAFVVLMAGVVMLILPGQGLLTIFIALVISDFSGKYHLEQKIVAQPKVFNSINWIRRRYNHPELIHPEQASTEHDYYQ